jgi:hypothetical protein
MIKKETIKMSEKFSVFSIVILLAAVYSYNRWRDWRKKKKRGDKND